MDSPRFSRRQFLQHAATTAIATGLGGCWPNSNASQVQFLRQSIPPQLISQFKRQFPQASLDFTAIANIGETFQQLETWRNPPPPSSNPISRLPLASKQNPTPAQLVSLGDRWMDRAIQQRLIQPLSPPRLTAWSTLDPRWQLLGQRNERGIPASTGNLWGVPYRWGTAMIVYRPSNFQSLGWTPKDWSDLWKPELRQRIAMVDDPREVIGLTLKKLGYSYNLANPATVAALSPALRELQQQVKFFSTKYYLQSLLNQDVWLAVGWSNEIVPLLKTNPDLTAVIPAAGTSLWADLWVTPRPDSGETLAEAAYEWLNFGFQANSLKQMALFSQGLPIPQNPAAPLPWDNAPTASPFRGMTTALMARCEFLAPLAPASQTEYEQLWTMMRSS